MWIESHKELENHPKRIHLSSLLKMDARSTIGLLHQFWWWSMSYAEDGDLRPYGMAQINALLGLEQGNRSLIHAKFIDGQPFLRIHNWFKYYGRYLKLKYRNNSKELMRIEKLCEVTLKSRLSHAKALPKSRLSEDTDLDLPTLTLTDRQDLPTYMEKATSSLTLLKPKSTPISKDVPDLVAANEREFQKLLKAHPRKPNG